MKLLIRLPILFVYQLALFSVLILFPCFHSCAAINGAFADTLARPAGSLYGRVLDSSRSEAIVGAVVRIVGSQQVSVTRHDGSFVFTRRQHYPLVLEIKAFGYHRAEVRLQDDSQSVGKIMLASESILTGQIVVTASRVPENILTSPVSIEKLDLKSIQSSPALTFFDAIEGVKGVQMITLGLGFKVPNTRGFSGTTNSRFLQMVDGTDVISPGMGAPIGNMIGPTDLDIESVELIPGAASALYGLNAVNGISNLKTKSPWQYQGLGFSEKAGVNHINDPDHGATPFNELAFRFAKTIGKHFAFKINASYSKGTDWIANNAHDQYFETGNKTNAGLAVNPGADLINRYGDEYNSDLKTLTLGGKKYDISRTGYLEKDLTDYAIHNFKIDGSLHYRFGKNNEVSYSYRTGTGSTLYQRGNRVRLDGERIQQHVLDYKGRDFDVKAYYEKENTGNNSFNMRPLGENLDLAFKKPAQWYADFTTGFNSALKNGSATSDALVAARAFADGGRLQPGTPAFQQALNRIIHINNWDTVGAQFLLKSAFVHVEGQYDWARFFPAVQIITGFNYRQYTVTPDGDNYVNPFSFADASKAGRDFTYTNYGAFISATKSVFQEKLKLTGSLRVDKSQYYSPKMNPRFALTFTPVQGQNFRMSFQNGYRFPTLFEGYAFVNNGGVKRLGGFPVVSGHLGVFENAYINSSVTAFKNEVNKEVNAGVNQNLAIANSKSLLVKSNYNYIQPEHINAFEVGYKGLWANNKLFFDIDYYFSAYDHFIGQLDVTQPYRGQIGQTDSTAVYAYNGGKQVHKFKMWTNSTSRVTNNGVEAGLTYYFWRKFNINANGSYARLVSISAVDAFSPAFNTPKLLANLSLGNRQILRNTGFNLSMHWQDSFYWNSPLAAGNIPSYKTYDAQVTYRIPSLLTTLKVGGTNLANKRYYQYLGGPSIGAFYYFSLVFDTSSK